MKYFGILLAALFIAAPAFADAEKGCGVISNAINPTEAQATDDYVNLTDGTFGTTAAAEDEFIVPVKSTVSNLWAEVDVAATANDSWIISVMDDGVTTGVTCTITGASQVTCASDEFSYGIVEAGSDLTVLIDSGEGAGVPATAAELRFGFCVSRF